MTDIRGNVRVYRAFITVVVLRQASEHQEAKTRAISSSKDPQQVIVSTGSDKKVYSL